MSARWGRASCIACVLGACLLWASLLGACNGQLASEPAPVEPAQTEPPASHRGEAASEERPAPAEGECNGEPCAPPKRCVRYAGIAGPRVPLYACGIPCADDGSCPVPMTCRVIADGPRLCE